MAEAVGSSGDRGSAPGPGSSSGATKIGRTRDARMVLTGVVAVLLVWFAFTNLQDVEIHFWLSSARAPLVVVIAISGALGALIGALVTRHRKHVPDS